MNDRRFTYTLRPSHLALALLAILGTSGKAGAQQKLRIVTTLPTYAAIARELTGDRAEIVAIARGDEDPHFVNPRPSFSARVSEADIFVVTGLDLEAWVPAVLDRARNPKVDFGGPGYVAASVGIKLLEVPADVSRTGGDIHIYGNPHIHTDPVNGIIIAHNILATLTKTDPANATFYEANYNDFQDRILRRLYGDQLVDLLGGEAIFRLARNYEFWDFARNQTYQGKPLSDYVGGWMAQAVPFRDRKIACYHKLWAYFGARFRVECAIYVEPKPGIPPSPSHLSDVVTFMREQHVPVLFSANYISETQLERVASRSGARAVIVPEHVDGAEGVDDYFKLVDLWVSRLAEAFLALDARREHR
jgi:ABC-type Zn uptake system ZnuABC Zn-binding protein ZnuA